jgi:hypothetical protein
MDCELANHSGPPRQGCAAIRRWVHVIGMQPGSSRECLNQSVEHLTDRGYRYATPTVIGADQLGVRRYLLLPSDR